MPKDFLEKTLEDIIMENKEIISSKGFPQLYKRTIRQLRLPKGGIIDIFSYEIRNGVLYGKIFELKRQEMTVDSYKQICSYHYELLMNTLSHFTEVNIELYLVGHDVSEELFTIMAAGTNVKVLFYRYPINGIEFKEREPVKKYLKKCSINLCPYIKEEFSNNLYSSFLEDAEKNNYWNSLIYN